MATTYPTYTYDFNGADTTFGVSFPVPVGHPTLTAGPVLTESGAIRQWRRFANKPIPDGMSGRLTWLYATATYLVDGVATASTDHWASADVGRADGVIVRAVVNGATSSMAIAHIWTDQGTLEHTVALDQIVNGVVTGTWWGTLRGLEHIPITRLSVYAAGNQIRVYVNNGSTPEIQATTTLLAGTKVGIARWPYNTADHTNGGRLDNLTIGTLLQVPYPPTLVAPAIYESIERSAVYRFTWQFHDNDPGDSQAGAEVRYRLLGSGVWTTVGAAATTNKWWDAPASSFTAGLYEWSVRTKDTTNNWSDWASPSRFSVSEVAAVPIITAPIVDEVVGPNKVMAWTVSDQKAYQVRTVNNVAGAPGATVYYDSGEVITPDARTHAVPHAVNGRVEHEQIRVRKQSGLWTAWSTVRVTVTYTPPNLPTITVGTIGTAIGVTYVNPAGGEPVAYNDLYLTEDGVERRVATYLPPSTGPGPAQVWTFHTPKSGVNYGTAFRLVAVGNNTATRSVQSTS